MCDVVNMTVAQRISQCEKFLTFGVEPTLNGQRTTPPNTNIRHAARSAENFDTGYMRDRFAAALGRLRGHCARLTPCSGPSDALSEPPKLGAGTPKCPDPRPGPGLDEASST